MANTKRQGFSPSEARTLIWWLITFRAYKVTVAWYWEQMGVMYFLAFRRAKETTWKEYKILKPDIISLNKKIVEAQKQNSNN